MTRVGIGSLVNLSSFLHGIIQNFIMLIFILFYRVIQIKSFLGLIQYMLIFWSKWMNNPPKNDPNCITRAHTTLFRTTNVIVSPP